MKNLPLSLEVYVYAVNVTFLFLNFDADNKIILAGMSVMGISSFCFANQPPGLSRPDVGECKSN